MFPFLVPAGRNATGSGKAEARNIALSLFGRPELARTLAYTARVMGLWMERHKERRQLEQLSDAMLRDVGLSHVDVWREARKPFWRD